jgi:hypothetical protein
MLVMFSLGVDWSADRQSVVVIATVDGQRVRCVVPHETLTAPFPEPPNEARDRELFAAMRSEFERRLRGRFESHSTPASGEVVLL